MPRLSEAKLRTLPAKELQLSPCTRTVQGSLREEGKEINKSEMDEVHFYPSLRSGSRFARKERRFKWRC